MQLNLLIINKCSDFIRKKERKKNHLPPSPAPPKKIYQPYQDNLNPFLHRLDYHNVQLVSGFNSKTKKFPECFNTFQACKTTGCRRDVWVN